VSVYVRDGGAAKRLQGVTVSRRTAKRVGLYVDTAGRLLDGRMSAAEFDRRFSRWRPIVVLGPDGLGGAYDLATAAGVMALAQAGEASSEGLVFDSGRRSSRRYR